MRNLALLLLAISLLPRAASAADAMAKVTFVLGKVEVQPTQADAARKAVAGESVAVQARLTTHARSVVTVELPDQSVIKIGPDSEVSLQEFSAPHGEREGATVISLISGSLFSKVHKQEGEQKFQVRTKAAAMGVRGTEFYTALGHKKGAGTDVWMCVREGEVLVKSVADGRSVSVRKGEGVVVPAGKPATKPKPYSWTKKLNWNMDPAKGAVLDETSMDSAYGDLLDHTYD